MILNEHMLVTHMNPFGALTCVFDPCPSPIWLSFACWLIPLPNSRAETWDVRPFFADNLGCFSGAYHEVSTWTGTFNPEIWDMFFKMRSTMKIAEMRLLESHVPGCSHLTILNCMFWLVPLLQPDCWEGNSMCFLNHERAKISSIYNS